MYISATHIYIVKEKVSLAADGQFIPPPKRWGTSCPFRLKTSVIYPYNTSFCHYRKLLCRTVYLVRCFLLNGAAGIVSGYFYRKYGIQYAMLSHALLHIISRTICLVAIP